METIAADAPAPGAGPYEARSDEPVDDTIAVIKATVDESLRLAGAAWALLRAELRLARSSAFVLIWLGFALVFLGVGHRGPAGDPGPVRLDRVLAAVDVRLSGGR